MQILFSDYTWGAATATALLNTAPRVRAAGEALPDAAALTRFLTEHGIAAASPGSAPPGTARPDASPAEVAPPTEADVTAVHALRTALRALLDGATDPAPHRTPAPRGPEGALAEGANALLARAAARPCLLRDPEGRWQWYVRTSPEAPLADQLGALAATGLLGTLRTLGPARFRPCGSPDCDGAFIDTSRAGRRRYCTPDLCGNRLNVANHRARKG